MNKKIVISLSIIGVVAVVVVGLTVAYFSSTETSAGNIFVAGNVDLKVNHTRQIYNGVDCKTCNVTIQSDTTNLVIAKDGDPISPPYNAYLATEAGGWAQIPGVDWIWGEEGRPASGDRTEYTFKNTFEWWGPIDGVSLELEISGDDDYWVYLNGEEIAHRLAAWQTVEYVSDFEDEIIQGENEITFVVKNSGGWYAGLLYKLTIDGNCEDDYFRKHCRLWVLKDLEEGDTFWNFDDVKPGDHGINVISLHAKGNDAYACLMAHNIVDLENGLTDPEIEAGDTTKEEGELSQFMKIFAWEDNGDGIYNVGDPIITGPNSPFNTAIGVIDLVALDTKYIGIAWCLGAQSVDGQGIIFCDGSTVGNIVQTDIMMADFTAYAEQQRNNSEFVCPDWNQVNSTY